MAIGHMPSGNRNQIEIIDAWRPAGSSTVLWALDKSNDRPLSIIRWGSDIYLPVTKGLRLGIGVHNGTSSFRAYPTYIEGANIYDGGPASPNACLPSHMWEVRPQSPFIMDAIINPNAQAGRPLVIVPHGAGFGIGEATFGTDQFRGQIRVYERSQYQPAYQPNSGFDGGYRGATRGGFGDDAVRGPATFGGLTRGATRGATRGGPAIGADHQVGIGAGAEEHRAHVRTGITYNQDASLVAALRVESRDDLAEVIRRARRTAPSWYWTPRSRFWYTDWQSAPTAGQVPVAPEPHWGGSGRNNGGGA
jgi:hypothetical protein